MSEFVKKLVQAFPHGSGFNGTSMFEERKTKVIVRSMYEHMNEAGFYDGVVDFTVRIPIAVPLAFRLEFNGQRSRYLARKHDLRQYIDDVVAEAIRMAMEVK